MKEEGFYAKKKILIVLGSIVFITILAVCFKVYLLENNQEVIHSSSLDEKTIELDKEVTVAFDHIEKNSSVKTNFYIAPRDGKINIKYIDGNWTNIKVNLYTTKSDEYIQTGKIKKVGKKLKFTNLDGSLTYYFKFFNEENSSMDTSNLILSFSE